MEYMKDYDLCYNIEYVPFNSEEHFGAAGELAYRQDCKQKNIDFKLVINIDSPGHIGSKAAISSYNLGKNIGAILNGLLNEHSQIVAGADWYSGDHAVYAMNGVPCIAVTSSDLFDVALEAVHTPKDTVDNVENECVVSE